MSTVIMRHPDVRDTAEVPESAVPFHRAAGWEVVEPGAPPDNRVDVPPADSQQPVTPTPPGGQPPAESGPEAPSPAAALSTSAAPRRSRATKKEEA